MYACAGFSHFSMKSHNGWADKLVHSVYLIWIRSGLGMRLTRDMPQSQYIPSKLLVKCNHRPVRQITYEAVQLAYYIPALIQKDMFKKLEQEPGVWGVGGGGPASF